MWIRRLCVFVFALSIRLESVHGQFVPGRIYISDAAQKNCQAPFDPDDRIWEVDPATGSFTLFATTPHELCGNMSGLAFKPDGSALRASVFLTSSILEIDGDANVSVALDNDDGIAGPFGYNNIAYDADGNFYVLNSSHLLKYPPDDGPPTLLAGGLSFGAIDVAPNGDVYYGGISDTILRINPDGQVETFYTFPVAGTIHSLVVDSAGNLFVSLSGDIYRFDQGNPDSVDLLAPDFSTFLHLTMSLDESSLFAFTFGHLYEVDASTGATTLISDQAPFGLLGGGLAVAVPEATSATLLIVGGGCVLRRRSSARAARHAPRESRECVSSANGRATLPS